MAFISKALWGWNDENKTPGSVIAPAPASGAPPAEMAAGAIAPVAAAPAAAAPAAAPADLAIAVPVPVAVAAAPAAKPQRSMAELILGLVLVFVSFLTTILAWAAAGSWWAVNGNVYMYLSFSCFGTGAGAICTNYTGATLQENNLRGACACLVFSGMLTLAICAASVLRLFAPASLAGAAGAAARARAPAILAAAVLALLGCILPAPALLLPVNASPFASLNGPALGLAIVNVILVFGIGGLLIIDRFMVAPPEPGTHGDDHAAHEHGTVYAAPQV